METTILEGDLGFLSPGKVTVVQYSTGKPCRSKGHRHELVASRRSVWAKSTHKHDAHFRRRGRGEDDTRVVYTVRSSIYCTEQYIRRTAVIQDEGGPTTPGPLSPVCLRHDTPPTSCAQFQCVRNVFYFIRSSGFCTPTVLYSIVEIIGSLVLRSLFVDLGILLSVRSIWPRQIPSLPNLIRQSGSVPRRAAVSSTPYSGQDRIVQRVHDFTLKSQATYCTAQ